MNASVICTEIIWEIVRHNRPLSSGQIRPLALRCLDALRQTFAKLREEEEDKDEEDGRKAAEEGLYLGI